MPTPVSTARQCLTTEASQALDEAVAVARRRGHPQTTSLHAVSALLLLPSSALREACGRARSNAYSGRIQFKALELCLGVSLDRLPSSPQRVEEPPVSNSLMAAIKRSQANQRRQPESFQLYQQQHQQQQQQQSSSISMVKVELQTLVLSILDDPIVSRVFSEAGFRSFDIKLAILRPVHQLLRYSSYRGPPMFLCNLPGESDLPRRGINFPFSGFPEVFNGDDNCRRIGEILARNKARNPLLIGNCANETLRRFSKIVERNCGGVLPVKISEVNLISIETDILKFVTENCNEGLLKLRFEEVHRMVEHCVGPGVIISYGDLNPLIGEGTEASAASMSYVVGEMTRLLNLYGGKVWLIGAATSYETYLKFSSKFPVIEKNWDLQLLPITSLRPSSMAESYSRSSLMESFVPFGGCFPTPSDLKSSLRNSHQRVSRCHLCNEKCEQEITAVLKGSSVADQYQSILPSWLQVAELGANRGLDATKAEDDNLLLNAKVMGLRRKWDDFCQHLHHYPTLPQAADTYRVTSQLPASMGFQVIVDKNEKTNNGSNNNANATPCASGCKTVKSCTSVIPLKISSSDTSILLPGVAKFTDENFPSKTSEGPSKPENLELIALRSPPMTFSNSSVGDNHTSPASATSVTTDLGLGLSSESTVRELEKPTNQPHVDSVQSFSGCCSADVGLILPSISHRPSQPLPCFCPDLNWPFDQRDFKTLYKALSEKISWYDEAIIAICQTIARCRTRNQKCNGSSPRGDIWFNFLGPDKFGMKKTAIALAEILYGSRDNFIHVDLSSQQGIIHNKCTYCPLETNGYGAKFRGKTVVDLIAGELSTNPLSVVFLDNIDYADLPTQNSLSQAVRSGRFSNSHGKDVNINNTIFVTTSRFRRGIKVLSSEKETGYYSEERILRAKGWPIQILVSYHDNAGRDGPNVLNNTRIGMSKPVIVNKRKLIFTDETTEEHDALESVKRANKASNLQLDLNLPAEETEVHETDEDYETDFISENSKAWLENFTKELDETVVFKSQDLDTLAEKILKEISDCFHKLVGWECMLEIDSEVMEKIVAIACVSDSSGPEVWIQQVLCNGFVEARKRYNLTSGSVLKLVTCEGDKQPASGIIMN